MNILVTGGAGYIGSHVCKALAAKGYVPITFDNLSRGNLWAVKWGVLERGDIADADQLRLVLEKYKPGALMHFAAYAYVGESVERPLLYYENNFAGTATLLRTVIDHQSVPVVFSSMMSSVLRKLGPRMVATHRSYHYTIKNRADKFCNSN